MPDLRNISSSVREGVQTAGNFASNTINVVKSINRGVNDIQDFTNDVGRQFDRFQAQAEMMEKSISEIPDVISDISMDPHMLANIRSSLQNEKDDVYNSMQEWIKIFKSASEGSRQYISNMNKALEMSDESTSEDFIKAATKNGLYPTWLGAKEGWSRVEVRPTVLRYNKDSNKYFRQFAAGSDADVIVLTPIVVWYSDSELDQSVAENNSMIVRTDKIGGSVYAPSYGAPKNGGYIGPMLSGKSLSEGSVEKAYGTSPFWGSYWSIIAGEFFDDLTQFRGIQKKINSISDSINIGQQFKSSIQGGTGPLGQLLQPISDVTSNIQGLSNMFRSMLTDPEQVMNQMMSENERFLSSGADISIISYGEEEEGGGGEDEGGEEENQPPAAQMTVSPTSATVDSAINFTSNSTDPDGTILQIAWDFGDGHTATGDWNINHSYGSPGTYDVKLTVTDNNGKTDSVTRSVSVSGSTITADFTHSPDPGLVMSEISFSDQSTDSQDDIEQWAWSFGDGSSSNEMNPSHIYTQSGDYTVQLTVTDANGNTDTKSIPVTVAEPISADFSYIPSGPVTGETISFSDESSSPPEVSIEQYRWEDGIGRTHWGKDPSWNYSNPDTYTVTLTIMDSRGLTDSIQKEVTVITSTGGGGEIPEKDQGGVSI